MKRNYIKISLANPIALFGLLILCWSTSSGQSAVRSEFIITSLENELVASIKIDERQTTLDIEQGQLFGVAKRADKRKYFTADDQMAFAVKYGDSSFKLRDTNEQLLWKVKVYDDYLKLSNNEEMTSPFRIAFSDSGKLKVKKDGEEQYAIRFDQKSDRFKVGNFYVMNFKNSLATGILLIEEIPLMQRMVLAAEILRFRK